MATTITRNAWIDDSGTPASPVGDGTRIGNTNLQNDIYARIDELFAGAGAYTTLVLGGLLQVQGFGVSAFTAGGTGENVLSVRNTAAGSANLGSLWVGNDAAASAGMVRHTSSTFAPSGAYVADGFTIDATRPGGLSLAASHGTGAMRFTVGGLERARLYASGALSLGAGLTDMGAPGAISLDRLDVSAGSRTELLRVKRTGGDTVTHQSRFAVIAFLDADNPTYTGAIGGLREDAAGSFTGGVSIFSHSVNTTSAANAITDLVEIGRFGKIGAFMSRGLALFQGTFDDEVFKVYSTDVSHGFTVDTDETSFGNLRKAAPTSGGLAIAGYTSDVTAVSLNGQYTNGNTTKGGSGKAAIMFTGNKLNLNTAGVMGANENIVVMRDNVNTRHIFDSDGDYHYDGAAPANYDRWDDVALARTLDRTFRGPDFVDSAFDAFVQYNRGDLERAGIVSPDGFINLTKHTRLLNGAIWQLAQRCAALAARVDTLESRAHA